MELNEIVSILEAIKAVAASRRINNAQYRTIGAGIDAIVADISLYQDQDELDAIVDGYEYNGDKEADTDPAEDAIPPVLSTDQEAYEGDQTFDEYQADVQTTELPQDTQEDDSGSSQEAD